VAFWQGTGFLLLGGILSRLLGLYRLVLPRLLGPEGVGLYHMAYPAYALTLALATGGLTVAISRLVAESAARGAHREAERILHIATILLVGLGAAGGAALFLGAPWLAAHVARDARAAPAIAAVAPAALLVAAMSGLRGYFQGYQDMAPTAISQVVEQLVRVLGIVALAFLLRPFGLKWAAAGVAGAAGLGAAAGLLLLLALRGRRSAPRGGGYGRPTRILLSRLVAIALPITITGLGVPVMQILDLVIVPAALQMQGLGAGPRTGAYGILSGYAMPLVALPAIISGAIAVALVPAVAAALARRDAQRARNLAGESLAATWRWLLPAALGLALLGRPIVSILFGSASAALSLIVLSPSALLFGLAQVAAAALQGYGRTWRPLAHLAAAAAVKAALTWPLVRVFGIVGAAEATSIAYLVWTVLNVTALRRLTGPIGTWAFMAPTLAAGGMAGMVLALGAPRSGVATLLTVAAAAAAYGLLLGFAGGFGAAEREAMGRIAQRARSMLAGRR